MSASETKPWPKSNHPNDGKQIYGGRDVVGYGSETPIPKWPNNARVGDNNKVVEPYLINNTRERRERYCECNKVPCQKKVYEESESSRNSMQYKSHTFHYFYSHTYIYYTIGSPQHSTQLRRRWRKLFTPRRL